MQLRIRARDLEIEPQKRRSLARSLRLALARHSSRIGLVEVAFSPGAPMHGERARRCELRIRTREGDFLFLEEFEEDVRLAAVRAAHRMGQRLDRQRFRRGFLKAQEAGSER
jgi:hypothetical protein